LKAVRLQHRRKAELAPGHRSRRPAAAVVVVVVCVCGVVVVVVVVEVGRRA